MVWVVVTVTAFVVVVVVLGFFFFNLHSYTTVWERVMGWGWEMTKTGLKNGSPIFFVAVFVDVTRGVVKFVFNRWFTV